MDGRDHTKQVLDLCDVALTLGEAHRQRFLSDIEKQDAELAESVRSLLRAIEDSGSFLKIDEQQDD